MRRGERILAVADPAARLGGRGAYLCLGRDGSRASADCAAAALKRGAVARALRAPASLDGQLVESEGR